MRPARSELRIFRNGGELARAAAEDFRRRLLQAGSPGRRFTCALSGGSTPRALFEVLAAKQVCAALPDQIRRSLHFFWSDERSVPPGHPDINFGMAYETLLRHAALPEANIHRIPAELGASQAADSYELELRRYFNLASGGWPVFDLIYLGLGEDGHTASLFPGSDVVGERHRLALAAQAPCARPLLILGQAPRIPLSTQECRGKEKQHLRVPKEIQEYPVGTDEEDLPAAPAFPGLVPKPPNIRP
jgi:6-phosphogluconolactonase